MRTTTLSALCTAFLLASCSSGADSDVGRGTTLRGPNDGPGGGSGSAPENPSSSRPSAGSSSGTRNDSEPGNGFIPVTDEPPPIPSGGAGNFRFGGAEDSCDGVDNDGNGIVDDVDVGMDGICDCLRIATLGQPGMWGEGDVFASWLDARSVNGATDLGAIELTAESLAPFEVIVAQNLSVIGREYSPAEVAALETWISAGGGLLTLSGYAGPEERTNANALLAPYGISYGAQQIAHGAGFATAPISEWTPHPVTTGVAMIGADNGYPVEGSGTAIASQGEHAIARALEWGSGHVLAWGDEWIGYDSEWVAHPDYQVELFWVNAIKWLTTVKVCQVPIPPTIPHVVK